VISVTTAISGGVRALLGRARQARPEPARRRAARRLIPTQLGTRTDWIAIEAYDAFTMGITA
jgi:hypothetical protein